MFNIDFASTAFFYCARSTAESTRARSIEVLCVLLKQLCISNPDQSTKNSVVREYEARKKKAEENYFTIKRLIIEDCIRLIIELIKNYSIIIILDVFDECDENIRFKLLKIFDNIINKSENVVKIFVSSRDNIDIVSIFYYISS